MKAIVFFSACGLLIMSFFFLLGWHLGITSFIQPPPSNGPVPYSSALCMLLSALALLSFFCFTQFPLSKILGIIIFLLGFQRVSTLLFPAGLRLNSVLNKVHFSPDNSSEMAFAAAIGFMLVGLVWMIWSKKEGSFIKKIFLLFFSILIVFLGAVEIFINILPIPLERKWQMVFVHFYTAIGLFLIGIGFVVTKFYKKLSLS